MTKKKQDKKTSDLAPNFDDILVCNNKRLRPYLEVFVQESENVAHHNLGTLIGVLEITDDSDDSSYIVNYLVSVIKKEYFGKSKRGPIESFEAALHKANLALSKLAEHGNINWIGKLNALVAVVEKNNLHLSQAGTASAFLLRGKLLTDVGEGLAPNDADPNPLKTFVNVSSGRLEINDKLIIATDGIFDIFSLEEIKKSALRFSHEKFIQFLKTALGNELEKAAVLVMETKEKKEPEIAPTAPKTKKINAFSQTSFVRPKTAPTVSEELKKELEMAKEEFVHKKTGHIYIKESEIANKNETPKINYSALAKEKIVFLTTETFNFLKKRVWKKITAASFPKLKFPNFQLPQKKAETVAPKPTGETKQKKETIHSRIHSWTNILSLLRRRIKLIISKILPDFSKIKTIAAKLDYQQRLYAILIIAAVVAVPVFLAKIKKSINEKSNPPLVMETQEITIPLEQDKNVFRLENLNEIYSGTEVTNLLNLNGKIFAVSQAEITALKTGENFRVPQEFGEIKTSAGMNDLNLIFLLNQNNKVLSWSPLPKKFQENNIAIPENAKISGAESYLTYLYLFDSANNQIYRYPRAEGGFGEKTEWLKDAADLSTTVGMTINENIFLADEKNILKFFRGKKQEFIIEETATPIIPHEIYAAKNGGNIYILDKQNARIVKFDSEGKIIAQYYHTEMGNANSFTINEEEGLGYFSAENSVKSLNLP